MSTALDALSGVLILVGAVFSLTAAVALVRFPDLLSRMHAATKTQVLGLMFVLTGAAIQATPRVAAGLLLVAAFQLLTAPVAAHVVGRVAYRTQDAGQERLVVDELAQETASRTRSEG